MPEHPLLLNTLVTEQARG